MYDFSSEDFIFLLSEVTDTLFRRYSPSPTCRVVLQDTASNSPSIQDKRQKYFISLLSGNNVTSELYYKRTEILLYRQNSSLKNMLPIAKRHLFIFKWSEMMDQDGFIALWCKYSIENHGDSFANRIPDKIK